MNGVALVVALAALGVNYDIQKSEDNKLEYVVQIEPELLKSLAEGREIHSAVPTDVGDVQRVLIRIGNAPAKHSTTSIAEYRRLLQSSTRYASADPARVGIDPTASFLWPAKTKPELNYYIKHGYQPNTEGVLEYFVQIDSTLLQTLAVGDEIRAGIDPAAGRVGKFVIRTGSDDLPRVPSQPVAAPAITRNSPGAYAGDAYAGASPSAFGVSPTATPLPSTPDYRTGSTAPTASSGISGGSVSGGNVYGPEPAPSASQFSAPQFSSRGSGTRFNTADTGVAGGYAAPTPPAAATQPPPNYGPPSYDNRFPPRTTIEPPPAYEQPPSYVARATPEQSPAGYQGSANYAPVPAAQDRLANVNRPATTAATLPAPQITGTGAGTSAARSAVDSPAVEKPWLPLMFTCFALFLSIGGNLYLGYTAGEYYSRYRLATERLRSAART